MDPPQPPQGNYSLFFDGVGDYVELPTTTDLVLTDGITLSAWIKIPLNQGNPWGGLIGGLDGYGYTLYAGSSNDQGRLNLEIGGVGGGNVRSNTDLRDGYWHHVAVTYNGNLACAYVDGVKENESSFVASTANNSDNLGNENLKFGHVNHNQSPAEFFTGNISHISIHNIALGEDDIMGLAQGASYYSGLVGKWDFNEGEGWTLTDVSGNNNHGDIIGADWSDDVPAMDPPPFEENHSLSFDGADDYVEISTSGFPSGNSPITVEGWFKRTSFSDSPEYMMSYGSFGGSLFGIGIFYSNNMLVTFDGSDYDAISSTEFSLNTWHHVAGVHLGNGYVEIYFDGVQVFSTDVNTPNIDLANGKIGSDILGNQNWDGSLDELRVWDLALSEDQIQHNMNTQLSGMEEGLVAYWNFNQGEGTVLTDLSGNGNHGTINGAEWSDDVPSLDPSDDPNVIDGFTFVGDHNGHRYYISDQGGNYLNGLELCEQNGGHLVTVTSQEENNFVIDALMAYGGGSNHLWLGLDDLDGDGIYHWVTNEPLVYTNFSHNPSPGQAIEMSTPDGHWNDTPIDDGQDYRRYMLEVPGGNPPPPQFEENHSLSFDGQDDYVNIASNPAFTLGNHFTIETWINPNSNGLQSVIQGWYGFGYQIYLDNSGTVSLVLREPNGNGVGLSSSTQLSDDNWYHIAAVLNEQSVQLYIDGNLDNEGTFNNVVTGNGLDDLSFGYSPWASEYLSSLLDEVRMWDHALSQEQIQHNMNTQLSGMEEGLVAYWNFNEGEGTALTDLSGNGNHGIIYGAEWSDDGAPVMPSSIAAVEVGTAQAAPNSEVLVPVFVDLMYESVSSVEINFSGFHDQMEFVGLETEGTMTGDAEWSSAVNSEEDLLLTLTYGANEIVGVGTLFHLKFQVLDNVTGEFIPVVIEYVQMDELDDHIDVMNGGVELYDLDWGDVSQNGEISGFDASLILKHLVGMEELDELQLTVADVTQDNTISALDASAIAQYVVNMIDELPVANMDAMTGRGNFYFEELSLVPGELLEVPIQLVNGDNLLSFEMEVDYDQETFTLEELVWSDLIEHFTVEENLESGSVKIAGMGATPDGQEGVFGTIRFYVNPDFSDPNTQVNIGYRINEQSAVDDVNLVIQNDVLGLENEMIPNEFTIGQNYPNPFNPTTRIEYGLPKESMVDITIYDMMGRVVSKLVKSRLGAGYHYVTWDATNNAGDPVSAGMYFYTVQAGEYRVTNKMLLLK